MDVMSAATILRQQLVALHNSDSTTYILERQCTSLNQQSLISSIEDNQSGHLRVVLRLSVTEGVNHMYNQYSNRKWAQVQSTARDIKSSLEADDNEQTSPVITSSPPGVSISIDKAETVWSSVFCELSRQE